MANDASSPSEHDAWLARFVRGDRAVMEQVYRETFDSVRRVAGRYLREPADRDNVVQQVFTDVVSDADLRRSYRGGQLTAWIGGIVRHRAIDFGRRQARLVALDSNGEPVSVEDPLADFRADLERFAATLEESHRKVVQFRFILGMTQLETAQALDRPRSTVEDWEKSLKVRLRAFVLGQEDRA